MSINCYIFVTKSKESHFLTIRLLNLFGKKIILSGYMFTTYYSDVSLNKMLLYRMKSFRNSKYCLKICEK